MSNQDDERLPFVDKAIVQHLKETYSLGNTLYTCKRADLPSAEAYGFMRGAQHVIDHLEALTQKEGE